jgi:hypothetical protein
LKRAAACGTLALIHRDPPLLFCLRKLNDAVFPYGFLLAVSVAFHFTMKHLQKHSCWTNLVNHPIAKARGLAISPDRLA